MESKRNKCFIGLSAVALALLLSGNALATPRGGGRGPARGLGFGPPAHAPAYGYRSKVVYGYTLIFDSTCGLYIVVGLTDCYYHEGRFYRWRGGVWEISLRADKWNPVGRDKLPAAVTLKAKSVAKYNSSGNGDTKSNSLGKDDTKPNGKANSNVKPDSSGGSDAKLNGGGPSDSKANAAIGTDGKADAKDNSAAKANSSGNSLAKPNGSSNSHAKPSGKSGNSGSGKARGSGKGKR